MNKGFSEVFQASAVLLTTITKGFALAGVVPLAKMTDIS
jgi:hypothetical protein